MNNLKYGVLACGLIGLIGCFLPMASGAPSFFAMREFAGSGQIFMVMAGFAVPLVMGAMGAAKGMQRWQSIVAAIGFGFVVFKMRDGFLKLITDGGIGAKLMGIGAAAGLVFAILTAVKPEPAK